MSVRILVADDEPDIAVLFKQRFRRDLAAGRFILEFALSGSEALRKAAAGPEPLVLVLSDVNMPEMSGLDLLPRLKREHPELPVLMVTAYADDATRNLAIERGAAGLLSKPIDFGCLRSEIEARIGG